MPERFVFWKNNIPSVSCCFTIFGYLEVLAGSYTSFLQTSIGEIFFNKCNLLDKRNGTKKKKEKDAIKFSSVQLLSCVWLFTTPWIAACQASLSITNSRSSLKLTSIESVMPSSHLILWQNVVHWRREWQATSVFLHWEPHEQDE